MLDSMTRRDTIRFTTVIICILVASPSVFTASSTISLTKFTSGYAGSSLVVSSNPTILDIISQINESTLASYIQTIQGFGPHPTGSDALEQLKCHLYNEFQSNGLQVRLDSWRYKLHHGHNIEATLPGIGSTSNTVIISAHYDSIRISPGADDDGSGVASVLTIAKIMSQYHFNTTIKFVLFSGEEQGLLGSHEYAQEARKNNEAIIGVLNLDGVGYAASTEDGSKVWNFADENAGWMVRTCRNIAASYQEMINITVLSRQNLPISDHQSFVDFGYVTNCFLEGTINPFYHTSEDTIDHMNITYLTKVCRLAAGTLTTIAQLNRMLSHEDLTIRVRGTLLSHKNFFTVRIENDNDFEDTANLTIHVELKNLRTGKYLTTPYNSTTNWTLTEEVGRHWEFVVGLQSYNTQLISFSVTLEGFGDDIGIYKKAVTSGVILPFLLVIIPRSF